jgi:hypothetical protein
VPSCIYLLDISVLNHIVVSDLVILLLIYACIDMGLDPSNVDDTMTDSMPVPVDIKAVHGSRRNGPATHTKMSKAQPKLHNDPVRVPAIRAKRLKIF